MDYENKFKERTKKHIELVNKYAKKLGTQYLDHDSDKFDKLFYGYKLYYKKDKTKEEESFLNDCTRTHISENAHHPEYWSNVDLTKFSRENPTVCHCDNMPDSAINEMCCDWCAMAEELGNAPFEWADKVINKRFFFSKNQVEYILNTLNLLWSTKPFNRFI